MTLSPRSLLCGLVMTLTLLALPTAAQAQDDDEEDGRRAPEIEREVREITRGTYAKSNVGGALYVGPRSKYIRPGTSLGLAFGKDFVDQERTSMAWEVFFNQGIHNGTYYDSQAADGCVSTNTCTQGDMRTYTVGALFEWSTYPVRRFGIGVRGGGGLLLSPLLMDPTYWQEQVVNGAFGGYDPGIHSTPHPVVMGGPTFEYYTKLAHFSAGADVDAFYALGFDIGISITGALKYTF